MWGLGVFVMFQGFFDSNVPLIESVHWFIQYFGSLNQRPQQAKHEDTDDVQQ